MAGLAWPSAASRHKMDGVSQQCQSVKPDWYCFYWLFSHYTSVALASRSGGNFAPFVPAIQTAPPVSPAQPPASG